MVADSGKWVDCKRGISVTGQLLKHHFGVENAIAPLFVGALQLLAMATDDINLLPTAGAASCR